MTMKTLFFVHPDIPRECILETVDVGADGFCGFRSLAANIKGNQDLFWEVKWDMLQCFYKNRDIYSKYFATMFDLERLERSVSFGLEAIDSGRKVSFCPPEYWFSTPQCAQLAVDTYRVPTVVYPCNVTLLSNGNFIEPPLLYLPFEGPKDEKKKIPQPLVLQHVGGCHWGTVKIIRKLKLEWANRRWRSNYGMYENGTKTKPQKEYTEGIVYKKKLKTIED